MKPSDRWTSDSRVCSSLSMEVAFPLGGVNVCKGNRRRSPQWMLPIVMADSGVRIVMATIGNLSPTGGTPEADNSKLAGSISAVGPQQTAVLIETCRFGCRHEAVDSLRKIDEWPARRRLLWIPAPDLSLTASFIMKNAPVSRSKKRCPALTSEHRRNAVTRMVEENAATIGLHERNVSNRVFSHVITLQEDAKLERPLTGHRFGNTAFALEPPVLIAATKR